MKTTTRVCFFILALLALALLASCTYTTTRRRKNADGSTNEIERKLIVKPVDTHEILEHIPAIPLIP